jgi:hypothetical protein
VTADDTHGSAKGHCLATNSATHPGHLASVLSSSHLRVGGHAVPMARSPDSVSDSPNCEAANLPTSLLEPCQSGPKAKRKASGDHATARSEASARVTQTIVHEPSPGRHRRTRRHM